MIKAEIYRQEGQIRRVRISGHSGYSENGSDIVCAGVSSVAQTAILGLIKVVGVEIEWTIDEDNGILEFEVPMLTGGKQIQAQAIVETMAEGIKDLEEGYKKYIKTEEKLCL